MAGSKELFLQKHSCQSLSVSQGCVKKEKKNFQHIQSESVITVRFQTTASVSRKFNRKVKSLHDVQAADRLDVPPQNDLSC